MPTSTVMIQGKARFNQVGQFLGYPLTTTQETISPGLAKRLHAYALQRLDDAGFKNIVEGWAVEVYTMDGDDRPANRSYCVKFKNAKGGAIEVIGILTRNGWPTLDHGYSIGTD